MIASVRTRLDIRSARSSSDGLLGLGQARPTLPPRSPAKSSRACRRSRRLPVRRVTTCPACRARTAHRCSRAEVVRRTTVSAAEGSKQERRTATSGRATRHLPFRDPALLRALQQFEPVTSTPGIPAAISAAISRRRAGSGSTTTMPRAGDLSAQRLISRFRSAAKRPLQRWARRNSEKSASRLPPSASSAQPTPDPTPGMSPGATDAPTKTPLRTRRRTRPSRSRSAYAASTVCR